MLSTLTTALLQWVAVVVLALGGSGVAAVFKQATLADACFRLALLAGGPATLLLHLCSPYYSLAPSWLEPAFHRWRVSRYFRVGSGPHSKSRSAEQAHSARPYRALTLPPCGRIVRWEYRTQPHQSGPRATSTRKLRVVSWNLEFGYRLSPIIAELQRLQPDILCIQEVPRLTLLICLSRSLSLAVPRCESPCVSLCVSHGLSHCRYVYVCLSLCVSLCNDSLPG